MYFVTKNMPANSNYDQSLCLLTKFLSIYPRANGAKRRSGRKPGARVTNSALAFTYIRIMRCYIAQWHSGIKSTGLPSELYIYWNDNCGSNFEANMAEIEARLVGHRDYKRIEWASRKKCRISRGTN